MNQTCHFGYEAHMRLCCSSIMRAKVGRGEKLKPHFRLHGETRGSGEGLNLLTRYLNRPIYNDGDCRKIFQYHSGTILSIPNLKLDVVIISPDTVTTTTNTTPRDKYKTQ